jgi:diguanylate cyclase (GGDEF)-like protein/PAS domain S-box-containing protein
MQFDFQDLLENMYDGLYSVDTGRKITYWNKAAERITGFSAKEVVGSHCSDNILIHVDGKGNNLCSNMCPLEKTIKSGISSEAEVFLHHKNGHRVAVWVRMTPLFDANDRVVGGVELFTDLSPQDAMLMKIEELEKLAFLDYLTKIANRHYLESELEGRLAEMKRYNLSFGILLIDIDHFKRVNDTHGHDVGDTVLKRVAQTLLHIARPFDLFGRWGGEEFVGIIRNVDRATLASIGERVRVLVGKTITEIPEGLLVVTVSIGAALASPDDTVHTLIKRADKLLYESKSKGRNRLTIDTTP